MILHVCTPDKFIGPFISLINKEFDQKEHQFWVARTRKSGQYPLGQASNTYITSKGAIARLSSYVLLLKHLHNADKVILHGLFNIRVVLLLAICPWVLKKCFWVIWGGDLYQYTKASGTLRSRIKEPLRRFVIRRVGYLVTYIEGDVELARQWYGAKGSYRECIMYLSNVVDPEIVADVTRNSDKNGLNILLGNSADPSNNHLEALERLLPYKDQDIKIYSPLSYGNQDHAAKVIAQGHEWFGDQFVPMTEFMPFEQYLEFLKSLDIAIFNHQRQQAMGNTITLLGMGKTVFMRSDVSQWELLDGLGIKLSDVAELKLQLIEKGEARQNARIIHSYFSKATLIKQLSDIFEAQDGLPDKRNTVGHGVQSSR